MKHIANRQPIMKKTLVFQPFVNGNLLIRNVPYVMDTRNGQLYLTAYVMRNLSTLTKEMQIRGTTEADYRTRV